MIAKRWVVQAQAPPAAVSALALQLGVPATLANLLLQRGVSTPQAAEKFFNPSLGDLHDPFLMKDMEAAVERVERALTTGETVMVYGDYDVDGTTAVALIYTFLRRMGHEKLLFYIPDRYQEGYGLSHQGVDYAQKEGVSLIITLDCGIKSVEKAEYARERGIDLIICDHHLPGETIPNAVAVLDAKRTDCTYPFKELSGCGVGFKLAQAYVMRNKVPFSELERLLDLTAVSIASDIVPLVDENRILAYYGLKRLNSNPNRGLKSIIDICGMQNHEITIDDIVFKIGPRINAAGRMATGSESPSGGHAAVNLMIERDVEAAAEFGNIIDEFNSDRKNIDRSVTQEAHELIEASDEMKRHKSIVIYNPAWMKGIVGIVASRLIETYYKPTVVLTMSNGLATGSARSVAGFDLYQAVESCADLLENFGGHTYAAGLTMKPENVPEFTRRFHAWVEANINPEVLVPQVDIDSPLLLSDITPEFRRKMARFQPFGPGNTAPVFMTSGVSNRGDAKLVGTEHEHLRADFTQREKPNTSIGSIAFGQPALFEHVRSGRPVDICYTIVENSYRGKVSPQLRIKDIKAQ